MSSSHGKSRHSHGFGHGLGVPRSARRGLAWILGTLPVALVLALSVGVAGATPCDLAASVGGGPAGISPGPTGLPNSAHLGWDVGSGQCNGSFTVTDDATFAGGHVELGLRAEQRSVGQVADNGGDYTVQLGSDTTQPNANRAWWNFNASIAYSGSINTLDALTLTVVTDRGSAVAPAPSADLLAARGTIDDRHVNTTPTTGFNDVYQISQNPLFGWLNGCTTNADCAVGTCTHPFSVGMCLSEEGAWKVTLTAVEGADSAATTICIHTPGTSCCGPRYVATTGSDTSNFCNDSGAPCATIQHAVDSACAGDVVNVAGGTYIENVVVGTEVTISGAGQGVTIVKPAVSNPVCGGGSLCGGAASNIFLVQADNVHILGLTANGDNPSLTSGVVTNGADLDARNGIITNHGIGLFNNLEVDHVEVVNVYLRGMYASSGGTFNFHDNVVTNVAGEAASVAMFNFGGSGTFARNTVSLANDAVSSNHSTGTQFSNNVVTASASGVHTDNAGDGGGVADLIQGNQVSNCSPGGFGIWVFVPYIAPTYQANTVTNCTVGLASFGTGNPVTTQFIDNTVDGMNLAGSLGIAVTTDISPFGSTDVSTSFTGNVITRTDQAGSIEQQAGFTTSATLQCNRITQNGSGIATQTAGLVAHQNSITDNGVGLDGSAVSSGTVDAKNNWWGCIAGPGNPGCDSVTGSVDASSPAAAPPPCVSCGSDADCDDTLVCNGAETCVTGSCTAGTPPTCGFGGSDPQCNTAPCIEPGGCTVVPRPNGFSCTTPPSCSVPDSCQTGVCTVGPGGGDTDADTVCDADDNCVNDANTNQADLDNDGSGDVCDPQEGTLNVTKLKLKHANNLVKPTGSVTVKGDFIAAVPDPFGAASEVTLRVDDATTFSTLHTWPAAECIIKPGRLKCTSADRKFKAKFKTFRGRPTTWSMTVTFRKQAIDVSQTFSGPVTATLSYGPTPPAIGSIDHVGVISDCRATNSGLSCRQF